MNSTIKSLLGEQITKNGTVYPVSHLHYTGKSENYITWNVSSEDPLLTADDILQAVEILVTVDIYSVGNSTSIKNEVFNRFAGAGWVYLGMGSEELNLDTNAYHTELNFKIEKGITYG